MELLYLILFVCYSSYAYNRKIVVFSMPKLKQNGLDASDAGLIISCQNIAFSIGKFLAGILSDRLNPYLLFAVGLLLSGSSTVVFSYSSSVLVFCCLWFLNGLAQGCGWPSCAKIIRETASPSQFGTLWSVLSSSNNFSGSVGPIISAYIIVHYGWEWNVFIAGILTLFLCGLFLLSLPFMADISNKKIQGNKSPSSSLKKNEEGTITDLFLDPFIWMLSLSFMVMFCAKTTTTDWGQMYLLEDKKHNQFVASAFTSSVETGGFVGRIAAGFLTDFVIRRNFSESKQGSSSRSQSRLSVAVLFLLGSIVSLHLFLCAVSETSSTTWIACVGAAMGVCFYGPIAIFGIVASESVPSHLSGSSNAIISLFGNIGATISGLPFNYIAKYYKWSSVFLLLEILAVCISLLLIRHRKLIPKIGKSKED